MEKKERDEKIVKVIDSSKYCNDGTGGLIDTANLFLALGDLLHQDTGEDSSIVALSFDTQEFGSLDFIVQMVLCANGKTYKRIVSPSGNSSKFLLVGGKKENV